MNAKMILRNLRDDRLFFARKLWTNEEGQPIEKLDAATEEYLRSDDEYILFCAGRRYSKTTGMEIKAVHNALMRGRHQAIALPYKPTAKYINNRIRAALHRNPLLGKMILSESDQLIRFKLPPSHPWGSIYTDVAHAQATKWRALGIDDLFFEEAQDHHPEVLAAIIPTLRGRTLGVKSLNFLGTRKFKDDFYMEFSKLKEFKIIIQPTCDAEVIGGKLKIHKIYTSRISRKELLVDFKIFKKTQGADAFLAEYCLVPRDRTGDVFDPEILKTIFIAHPLKVLPTSQPVFSGLDLGFEQDNSVFVFSTWDRIWLINWVHVFPLQTTIGALLEVAAFYKKQFQGWRFNSLDGTGNPLAAKEISDGLLKLKIQNIATKKHIGVVVSEKWKLQTLAGLKSEIMEGNIKIIEHDRLRDEMLSLRQEDLKKSAYGSPDCFDALLLNRFASWKYRIGEAPGGMVIRREAEHEGPLQEIVQHLRSLEGGTR